MKKYLKDILWDTWYDMPWCRKLQREYANIARNRFDYSKNGDISIISSNCIAGEIYHILGLQFLSPIINISMDRNDFVSLALDLEGFLANSLEFNGRDKYGFLTAELQSKNTGNKILFSFPHEKNEEIIYNNFERRKMRVNYSKLYYITDDCGMTDESFRLFAKVSCKKKIILTTRELSSQFSYAYQLTKVGGGIVKYQRKTLSGLYEFQKIWDYVTWFNED